MGAKSAAPYHGAHQMSQDYLGNAISDHNPATVTAINDFIGGFLGYETRAERILKAAEADPASLLANVYAGFLWMFLESTEAGRLAMPFLRRAQGLTAAALPRERLNLSLLRAWVDNDIARALSLGEALLVEHPKDLFVVKLLQYLYFNMGDSPAMLRLALNALPGSGQVAQMHGMLAFAYEQCHLLPEAEASARQALQLEPREPWAQHALAHVLLTESRIEEGLSFLERAKEGWRGLNSFMYTHNWWHLALFHLARGHDEEVLDIYDRHVWGIFPEYSQDQIGAVSLLVRLELAGVDVGQRWQELADYLRARRQDCVQPFLSLQYLYGLARAGRPEALELMQALHRQAESAPAFNHGVWREVTLPTAEALYRHARGEQYGQAAELLDGVLARLVQVGGSHAQRDLFALIAQDAHLQAGHWSTAQQLLEQRRRLDPQDAPSNRALGKVYRALGLAQLAAQAQQRLAPGPSSHGKTSGNTD